MVTAFHTQRDVMDTMIAMTTLMSITAVVQVYALYMREIVLVHIKLPFRHILLFITFAS